MKDLDVWDEYKYRHDLIWRKVHQFTIIMVSLGTAPHIELNLELSGKILVEFLPIIGTLFGIFGSFVLENELSLFRKIKIAYREMQNDFMEGVKKKYPDSEIPKPFHENKGKFVGFFRFYYYLILIISFLNCIIFFKCKFGCIFICFKN